MPKLHRVPPPWTVAVRRVTSNIGTDGPAYLHNGDTSA